MIYFNLNLFHFCGIYFLKIRYHLSIIEFKQTKKKKLGPFKRSSCYWINQLYFSLKQKKLCVTYLIISLLWIFCLAFIPYVIFTSLHVISAYPSLHLNPQSHLSSATTKLSLSLSLATIYNTNGRLNPLFVQSFHSKEKGRRAFTYFMAGGGSLSCLLHTPTVGCRTANRRYIKPQKSFKTLSLQRFLRCLR